MPQIERGLTNNLRFLVLEVTRQIETTLHLLDHPHDELKERIRRRDGYIDHLNKAIGNQAFRLMQEKQDPDHSSLRRARSATIIASNLERIGDHAVSIVGQIERFVDPAYIARFEYHGFFNEILAALSLVVDAFERRDTTAGISICRTEPRTDAIYRERLNEMLAEMDRSTHARNLVPCVFIFHYLERMGDSLLNVGEAILLSRVGEKVKYREFAVLSELVGTRHDTGGGPVEFQEVWDTKSGADVARVDHPHESEDVVYKHGDHTKMRLEKENLERWSRIKPRLAPRVVEFQEDTTDESSMLLEFLNGRNLQEILLSRDRNLLIDAIEVLLRTLREIWTQTKSEEEVKPKFIGQLVDRLDKVYQVHPRFRTMSRASIGDLSVPGFDELLERLRPLDDELVAPFSVFGHGDFNVDNIIYTPNDDHVHFVDVHRSQRMDCVQDLSVFLVSNFRLPVFDHDVRTTLNQVETTVFRFARSFAREHRDLLFEARLAAGLARSLITSTRFEFDSAFAENMMRRGVFLLHGLHRHGGRPWELYRLPEDVLFY